MNKEQIIDEVYNKWIKYSWNSRIYPNQNDKDIFIDRIKSEPDFSIHWGLKIEERELDMFERWELANLTPNMSEIDYCNKLCDKHNVPTKLITITYKDTIIESYENNS
jgi:hypothetical protein